MKDNATVDPLARDNRIAIVMDPTLKTGQMANRAAVLATGLAAHHPEIVGKDLQTADGRRLSGITKVPMAVLAAKNQADVAGLSVKAAQRDCTLLVYLTRAQGLRSYSEYEDAIAQERFDQLDVDAVLIYGPKKTVNKLTGNLPLIR